MNLAFDVWNVGLLKYKKNKLEYASQNVTTSYSKIK